MQSLLSLLLFKKYIFLAIMEYIIKLADAVTSIPKLS